jgi:hypothetical protein
MMMGSWGVGGCSRLPTEGGTVILAPRAATRAVAGPFACPRPLRACAPWLLGTFRSRPLPFSSRHGNGDAASGLADTTDGVASCGRVTRRFASKGPDLCGSLIRGRMATCRRMMGTLRCSQSSSPVPRLELRLRMYSVLVSCTCAGS